MSKRIPPHRWRRFGLGLIGLVILVGCVRTWAVPALVVGQNRSNDRGLVTLRSRQGPSTPASPLPALHLAKHAEDSTLRSETKTEGRAAPIDAAVGQAAYEPTSAGTRSPALPKREGTPVKLPKTISTEIDLEDVELSEVLARASLLGIKLPWEVAGRFSLKAQATIPLGTLRDLKAYVFHGQVTLSAASIAGVDLGHASARLDVADGVVELSDLRGQLVNRPDGGSDNRPEPTAPIATRGPLPPGGFRGRLRAELSPPGSMEARIEAEQLPLGELAAPALPRPTPLSGLVSVDVEARAAIATLADPKAWTAAGTVRSERITYRARTLDSISARFTLESGRLAIPELAAKLADKPLTARLEADLAAPYAFAGRIDVAEWSLDDLIALVPGVPHPAAVGGLLSVRAEAEGTLAPWAVETQGQGRLGQFRAGPIPLGDIPFRWDTGPDAIVVSGIQAQPLGGRLEARARIPTRAGEAAEGTITVIGIDTAQLSALMPGRDLELTGTADLSASFAVPTVRAAGAPAVVADVRLSAPDLTIQGVPTRGARGSLSVHEGLLTYEVVAQTLGGEVRFGGNLPLNAGADTGAALSRARLQAGWFRLATLWKSLGMTGPVTQLDGLCALGANLNLPLDSSRRWAYAAGEIRGLRWDKRPLGSLRGNVAVTPTSWQVRPLTGELLGGSVQGGVWSEATDPGRPHLGFNVNVERFELARLAGFLLGSERDEDVRGFASVSLEGQLEKAKAEVRLEQARVFDLPLSDLRVPAEFLFAPKTGVGTLQIRQSTARLAGGQVRGDARLHFGAYQDFQTDLQLTNLDLRAFKWISTNDRRPASGRVSGRVKLESPASARLGKMRGKVHLDLVDASLFELPIFRQINQFLGSELGGIFEAGELDLTLAGGTLKIDKLALVGRLLQLRAQGTIGFDSLLDLEVVLKTNQVIPQAGRAVVGVMLGRGRRSRGDEDTVLRTSNPLSSGPVKLRISGSFSDPKITTDSTIDFSDK
jgi:translocation and assembly module TamB